MIVTVIVVCVLKDKVLVRLLVSAGEPIAFCQWRTKNVYLAVTVLKP